MTAFTQAPARAIAVLVLATAGLSLAADQKISLASAVTTALQKGPDIANTAASLATAQADYAAKQADPGTLVTAMTQARQALDLAKLNLAAKRLDVMNTVVNNYVSLYEAQENIDVLKAQVALDSRNLDIAKAKLAAKNATALDVARAESTLAADKQSLADATAQLPILSAKLVPVLGMTASTTLTADGMPAFAEKKVDLAKLEDGLDTRLGSVVQANQSVETAQLNVKLADNDYTPAATLRDAKTSLESAQRNLDTVRKNAVTSLRDAYRSLSNALQQVSIAKANLANARESLAQDQARFKAGTIAQVTLQSTQLSAQNSEYSLTRASDSYLKALASLSIAAGQDLTGLVGAGS